VKPIINLDDPVGKVPFASPELLWRMKRRANREGSRWSPVPAPLVRRAGSHPARDL